MWYAPKVNSGPSTEPVTLDQAKTQVRVGASETDFDADLTRLIGAARAHVESYCGVRLGTQAIEMKCEAFTDFSRLPVAPVQSVTSIAYTDADGASQTLGTGVYELRIDGLNSSIILKNEQSWPEIQSGSLITVTVSAGYATVPAEIIDAMLLYIAQRFDNRSNDKQENWTAFDALLSNHRWYG